MSLVILAILSSFVTAGVLATVDLSGEQATPIVCGPAQANDYGFGDADRIIAIANGEEIEWIAFTDGFIGNEVIVSGIEIMYQRNPKPFIHGKMDPSRRYQLDLSIEKKEHIVEVRFNCAGPVGNERVQYISIMTSLVHRLTAGRANPRGTHVFRVNEKKVSSFSGFVDSAGNIRSLGLIWTNKQWGNWPASPAPPAS